MFRQLIAILFLFSQLAQAFDRVFVVADYYLNQSSFIKYCENKSLPQLRCNGKCFLAKLLKQKEKEKQEQQHRHLKNKQQELSSKSFFAVVPVLKIVSVKLSAYFICPSLKDRSQSVFHPPPHLS